MNLKQTELLAPAGNYESFIAAINAGADAVYVGGNKYSARAYAKNFSEEELLAAIDYAHLFGKKLYLTVNTLCKNEELSELIPFLKPYYLAGLDAVIVQDIGAVTYIREAYPDMHVHASTQMTITDLSGVKLLEEMGVSRVVLARELSLAEIKNITSQNSTEIECFVHGALCYCYSGKCLFSGLIGGRSGNRGRCAQPCRLPYDVLDRKGNRINKENENYILSPKDICTIALVPQLIDAGITSFKIEGRMKRAEYVAGVTRIYRKYIDLYRNNPDKHYHVTEDDYHELIQLYTRSGSTKGYYVQKNGRDMITLSKPNYEMGNEARFQELHNQYVINEKKISVQLFTSLHVDQKAYLKAVCQSEQLGPIEAEWYGTIVEASQKRPLSDTDIDKQLRKTGNTRFVVDEVTVDKDDNIFMPIKALNDLRRETLDGLQYKILSKFKRNMNESKMSTDMRIHSSDDNGFMSYLTASVEVKEVFESLVKVEMIRDIYISFSNQEDILQALQMGRKYQKNILWSLPLICRKQTTDKMNQYLELLQSTDLYGVLIHNLETLQWLKENDYKGIIVSDFDLYAMNDTAANKLRTLGCDITTASVELNEKELWGMERSQMELVIYGYLPMMISAQCVQNTALGCCKNKENDELILRDRYGKHFPMKRNCDECYNVIYNSVPLSLHTELTKLQKMKFNRYRLRFTIETPSEAMEIIQSFQNRLEKGNQDDLLTTLNYTKGHFKRGVE